MTAPRAPSEMEARILEALKVLAEAAPRAANETGEQFMLRVVRATIREMRIPTMEMIEAMGRAINRKQRGFGGHITWSLKHQMRWAAAIDKASPE